MKYFNKLSFIFSLSLLLVLTFSMTVVQAESNMNDIHVYINGNEEVFDQPPIIEDGRTLVPIRGVFEELGGKVAWNQETKEVTADKDNNSITLKINSNIVQINGVEQTIDVPAKLNNGRTLVPLRFVSESIGSTVKWDSATRTVTITSESNTNTNNNTSTDSNVPIDQTSNDGTTEAPTQSNDDQSQSQATNTEDPDNASKAPTETQYNSGNTQETQTNESPSGDTQVDNSGAVEENVASITVDNKLSELAKLIQDNGYILRVKDNQLQIIDTLKVENGVTYNQVIKSFMVSDLNGEFDKYQLVNTNGTETLTVQKELYQLANYFNNDTFKLRENYNGVIVIEYYKVESGVKYGYVTWAVYPK